MDEVPKDDAWKNNRCREAAVLQLSKWSCDNPQTPNALEFLSAKGQLVRVIDAAIPVLRQVVENNGEQGLWPGVVTNILSRVVSAEKVGTLVTNGFATVKFRPWQ